MKPIKSFSFFTFGTIILGITALTIAVKLPDLANFQRNISDHLITQAKASQKAGDNASFLLYLHEAELINPLDNQARTLRAGYYQTRGDLSKALAVYRSGPTSANPAYLGKLALKAQHYPEAEKYFNTAIKEGAKVDGLAGKALALFNQKKTEEGCAAAAEAYKLDINSSLAERAAKVCLALSDNPATYTDAINLTPPILKSKRQLGYFLLANDIVTRGEEELASSPENTPADWLLLAKVAVARDDFKKAQSSVEQGLKLDRTNLALLQLDVVINEKLASQNSGKKREDYQAKANKIKIVIPYISDLSTRER